MSRQDVDQRQHIAIMDRRLAVRRAAPRRTPADLQSVDTVSSWWLSMPTGRSLTNFRTAWIGGCSIPRWFAC